MYLVDGSLQVADARRTAPNPHHANVESWESLATPTAMEEEGRISSAETVHPWKGTRKTLYRSRDVMMLQMTT